MAYQDWLRNLGNGIARLVKIAGEEKSGQCVYVGGEGGVGGVAATACCTCIVYIKQNDYIYTTAYMICEMDML